jgi:cytochrome P450
MTPLAPETKGDGTLLGLLASEEFIKDPFPTYSQLRLRPGWRSPSGYRVFSTHPDLVTILRDPDRFGQTTREHPSIHEMDPPEHTRLRRLVSRAFTPRAAAAQESLIGAVVDDLLDAVASKGEMDLVRDLAIPMPARIMADLLGVPATDAARWQAWMEPIKESRGVVHYFNDEPSVQRGKDRRAAEVGREAASYLLEVILLRQQHRRGDLVSGLLTARDSDETLTEDEVLFVLFTILAAGIHTTASQLSNLMRALLNSPGGLETLVADEAAIDNAVEEGLRYDAALQAEHRVVRVDVTVGGVELAAGEKVLILNGAANRDPAVFDEPDRFDIHRSNARSHLTFGWGTHRCLGAALAKAELVIAVQRLVARTPDLRSVGEPVQHPYDRWRGLQERRVAWDTRRSL